ncbi:CARDB domain-containing protein [Halostella litorea]|uniref:CARDB domain-containing protein n=1 Tax=Halostella litorea TaxID=2528831 RepID=UPI001092B607|nr:CARDB domain-containing protein [Halostella litorea]
MPGPSPPDPADEDVDAGEDPYSALRDPTVLVLLVIVVGAVLAMVVGLGGPAVVGGNDSGPVFPIPEWFDDDGGGGDGASTVDLRIDANRSAVRPGDAVGFTVARADGGTVDGATVSVAGETYPVTDGAVAVRFDAAGEYTATASATGGDNVTFADAETTVAVERYVTNLSLSANATDATAGDAVRFTVTDGSDPIDATLRVDGTRYETEGGSAVVTFPEAGEFTATVRKDRTPTRRYERDAVDVDVRRRTAGLAVALNDSDPVAHEPFRVRVTRNDTGEPAPATVGVGGEPYDAGSNGLVNVTVDRIGDLDLTATAPDTPAVTFRPVNRTVTVDRRPVSLSLAANRSGVDKGEAIEFALRRSDTGAAVNGTLAVDGAAVPTDANGTAVVPFDDPGQFLVEGHRPDTATETFNRGSVLVTVRGSNYSLSAFDAPDEVTAGERVTVTLNVTNDGNEPGGEWLAYRFDGQQLDREYVALDPSESETVAFEATVPEDVEPGEYRHAVVAEDGTVDRPVVVTAANETASIAPLPAQIAL